jgi:hypothetical protein
MRLLLLLGLVACASGPAYRLSVNDRYEVGEDPTISVAIRNTSKDQAVLIVRRPDGSSVRQKLSLSAAQTNIRFGGSVERDGDPTFNEPGDYRVELRSGETILAQEEIRISVDRLTRMFEAEEIAGFALLTRFTRTRANKKQQWKTYGAVYQHTLRSGTEIQVVIEDPKEAFDDVWQQYVDEGTLGVIENSNVRVRERSGSVSASWVSGKKIIAMRAATLDDIERGFIGHFLARYPSEL